MHKINTKKLEPNPYLVAFYHVQHEVGSDLLSNSEPTQYWHKV